MANDPTIPAALRARLSADLAAGRTVSLSAEEMADPTVRAVLPELLAELDPSAPENTPLRLAHYSILGEIGRGGMSTVYLARDETLARNVALKVLQPAGERMERLRARMLREARALARLSHPHIVTVYEVVETADVLAIAMEWIDGLTLAGLVDALPPEAGEGDIVAVRAALGTDADADALLESTAARTFARMIRDVALAVDRAHQLGLLHLDIKPSNVLVRRNGTALLADFGVVRELDVELTQTRSFAGTPVYAAPEQLQRNDDALGPPTDVYGLGLTLYELLARARPIEEESLGSMLRRIETGRVPRLSSRAQVSRDLESVVHKAIAFDPGQRYATARELADDLTAWLEGRPVAASPEGHLQRLRRWARSEPWKATLVAVLLVITPVVIALGATLALNAPRIYESRNREQRDRAQQHAQDEFMAFLMRGVSFEQDKSALREALALDPENESLLACLLTQLGQENRDLTLAELERLPAALRDSDGVRALAARVRTAAPFLPEPVAERLAASRVPLDLLLVALDCILAHHDSQAPRPIEIAREALARLIALRRDADHMARGLQAWVAGRLGDEQLLKEACLSLEALWPENHRAKLWQIYAYEGLDPARAAEIALALSDATPDEYGVGAAAAAQLARVGRHAEALAVMEHTKTQDDREERHRRLMLPQFVAQSGDPERARALLIEPPPRTSRDYLLWLSVIGYVDSQQALARFEELIANGTVPPMAIDLAMEFATQTRNGDLLMAAATEGRRRYPGLVRFRWATGTRHVSRREYDAAADDFAGLPLPIKGFDDNARFAAAAFCGARRWQDLLDLCQRWQQREGHDVLRQSYYLGMACARTGRPVEAMACFDRHIALGTSRGKDRAGAWFERMLLLVSPDSPPELRDPGAALRGNYARLEEVATQRRAPWFLLILAEVQFANGHVDEAINLAELAQLEIDNAVGEEAGPADLETRIDAALARYRTGR